MNSALSIVNVLDRVGERRTLSDRVIIGVSLALAVWAGAVVAILLRHLGAW